MAKLPPRTRNLIISSSILILLIVIGFFNRSWKKDNSNSAETVFGSTEDIPASLTSIPHDHLRKVEIRNRNDAFTLLSEDGELWLVEDAFPGLEIDESIQRSLLWDLSNLSGRLISSDTDNLAMYGLEKHRAEFRITGSDGQMISILFGSSNPDGDGIYARVQGDNTVYLVQSTEGRKAFFTLNDLRETALPTVNFTQISSITLRSGQMMFQAVPHTEELDPYQTIPATMDVIVPWERRYLISMDTLQKISTESPPPTQISRFPDKPITDTASIGLDSRSDLIEITSEDQIYRLELGNETTDGYRYAREASNLQTIFLIEKTALGILDVSPFELTSKHVFLADIQRVRQVMIQAGEADFILEIDNLVNSAEDEMAIPTSYRINSQNIAEKDFKAAYQAVIALYMEGLIESSPVSGKAEVVITFSHINELVPDKQISFIPYNPVYYAVVWPGETPHFLIGKYQLKAMLETLAAKSLTFFPLK